MPLLCASLHTGNWESKLNQLSPCRTYCQQHWTSRRNCYNSQWINNWGSLTRHWPILDRSAQLSSRYNCLFLSTLQWIINEIYPSSVGIGNASRPIQVNNEISPINPMKWVPWEKAERTYNSNWLLSLHCLSVLLIVLFPHFSAHNTWDKHSRIPIWNRNCGKSKSNIDWWYP